MEDQSKLGATSFLETNKICYRTAFLYRKKSYISMGRQFILNINQANICTFSPNLLTKRHNTETRLVFHLIVPTLNMVHIYMTALKRTQWQLFTSLAAVTHSAHSAYKRSAHTLPGTQSACFWCTVTCHKPTAASVMQADLILTLSASTSIRLWRLLLSDVQRSQHSSLLARHANKGCSSRRMSLK